MNNHTYTPEELLSRSKGQYTNSTAFSIVETTDKCFYVGVRVENKVYPLTIESAQSALATAISQNKIPFKIHSWRNEKNEIEPSVAVYCKLFGLTHEVHLSNETIPELKEPKIFNEINNFSIDDWPSTENSARISNFLVGVLLKTAKGWLLGTNFEHPFLGLGLCAERTAFAMALSYGLPIENEIHIFTKNNVLATPCGACRQVGSEILPSNTTAYLKSKEQSTQIVKWPDLLPFPFNLT